MCGNPVQLVTISNQLTRLREKNGYTIKNLYSLEEKLWGLVDHYLLQVLQEEK